MLFRQLSSKNLLFHKILLLVASSIVAQTLMAQTLLDQLSLKKTNSLADFKLSVEKAAYQTTLKLCEGYRQAQRLGPHPYHGRYMFSVSENLNAWVQVASSGAYQPISGRLGLKGIANELNTQRMTDFSYWFGSMRTLYLINSDGFLKASVHCLNSTEESKLQDFAGAVLTVDYVLSSTTYFGAVIAGKLVLQALSARISYSWALQQLQKLVGRSSVLIGGITLSVVATDNLLHYIANIAEKRKLIDQLTDPTSEFNISSAQKKRFLKLFKSFELALDLDESHLNDFLNSRHSEKEIEALSTDYLWLLAQMRQQKQLTKSEQAYLDLLIAFLPLLTATDLPQDYPLR